MEDTQLQFRGRGWPRSLTPREIEQRRQAGRAAMAKLTPGQRSSKGRKGYQVAVTANPDFHAMGGTATAHIDAYTSKGGSVGLAAWLADGNPLKGKKHRYLGSCKCCSGGDWNTRVTNQEGRF